jgi:hypothetical protein
MIDASEANMTTKLSPGTLERLWNNPDNWRGSILYVCRDDPRLVVPKRQRWGGWTVNCAHAGAWILLLAILLLAIIPTAFLAFAGLVGSVIFFAFIAGYVALVCIAAAILASPKRYEAAG